MSRIPRSGVLTAILILIFLLFISTSLSPILRLFSPDATPYKFTGYVFTTEFEPIEIAKTDEVKEGDGKSFSVLLSLPSTGPRQAKQNIYGILVNWKGEFKAYSAVCPHLNCTVRWINEKPENQRLWCNCHEGSFDPGTGAVTGGPPPKGLTPFGIEIKDDTIYLTDIGGGT